MAVIESVHELPHLGGIEPGNELEHLLVDPPYDHLEEVISAIDVRCPVLDQPRGFRIATLKVIELTKHEESQDGLEYYTRSLITHGPLGIKEVLSIITPKNGPKFGLTNDHYGGVHRMDNIARFEKPLSPEAHWERLFKGLLSKQVAIITI